MSRLPLASERPKVLLASYHFPPDAAVGGLRAAKFARALPEFGWDPLVLTVRDEFRDQGLDPGRLRGLEGTRITRTRELPHPGAWLLKLPARLRRSRQAGQTGNPPTPAAASVSAPPHAGAGPRESAIRRVKRWFISLVMTMPDDRVQWAIYAAFSAVRLVRRERIDCLITSAPPFSVHAIGLFAKIVTNVTWVADFRDPWEETIDHRPRYLRSAFTDAAERWMERRVMLNADRIVTATERMRQSMIARYPRIPQDKFISIPNSIDSQTIEQGERAAPDARDREPQPLTITYAGNLYFGRNPEPLFQAVSELIASGRATDGDVRVKLLGNCREIDGVPTAAVVGRYGLERVVEVIDRVPYADAVRIMQASHLLLVLAPGNHELVVPAKLYDYLGSGSRVLGLAGPGATADLMRETGSGECFAPSDVDGLREYLGRVIGARDFASLRNRPEAFARYDVRHLTERLAREVLDPCVRRSGMSPVASQTS